LKQPHFILKSRQEGDISISRMGPAAGSLEAFASPGRIEGRVALGGGVGSKKEGRKAPLARRSPTNLSRPALHSTRTVHWNGEKKNKGEAQGGVGPNNTK